jgi:hypothetical protein
MRRSGISIDCGSKSNLLDELQVNRRSYLKPQVAYWASCVLEPADRRRFLKVTLVSTNSQLGYFKLKEFLQT